MPVLTIWGADPQKVKSPAGDSRPMSYEMIFYRGLPRFLAKDPMLNLRENMMTVLVPALQVPTEDIICFVDAFLDRPERTMEVKRLLVERIGQYLFTLVERKLLVEVILRCSDGTQVVWSSANLAREELMRNARERLAVLERDVGASSRELNGNFESLQCAVEVEDYETINRLLEVSFGSFYVGGTGGQS